MIVQILRQHDYRGDRNADELPEYRCGRRERLSLRRLGLRRQALESWAPAVAALAGCRHPDLDIPVQQGRVRDGCD